ncbi:MAG: lytic murein transglycosylase, partial [Steroidobacteraceae bacterium]
MSAPITKIFAIVALVLGVTAVCAQAPAPTAHTAPADNRTPAVTAPAATAPAATAPAPAAPAAAADLADFDPSRPEIRAYIKAACARGLARAQVIAALTAAEPQPQIIDARHRPAEKPMQWWQYRARMLTPGRIEAGAR